MHDIKELNPPNQSLIDRTHPWYFFICFLQNLGLRVTESRKIIFNHIIKKTNHFNAEEISHELSGGRDRVSRATVYVTLELIKKSGIIRSITTIDNHRHYEVNDSKMKHQHMKCYKCGRIIEFNSEELENTISRKCNDNEFYIVSTNLVITGLCSKCSSGN